MDYIFSDGKLVSGVFDDVQDRLAKMGESGLTLIEFGKLRVGMTDKGRNALGDLITTIRGAARDGFSRS